MHRRRNLCQLWQANKASSGILSAGSTFHQIPVSKKGYCHNVELNRLGDPFDEQVTLCGFNCADRRRTGRCTVERPKYGPTERFDVRWDGFLLVNLIHNNANAVGLNERQCRHDEERRQYNKQH